jgi:hypothetical protein
MADTPKLTAKQTGFIDDILAGYNQTDAYERNYDTQNMLRKSVREKASELAATVNVSSTIQARKAQIEAVERESLLKSKVWDLDKAMSEVSENLALSREFRQMSAAVQSTKQAIDLSGLSKTEAQGGSVQINSITYVLTGADSESVDVPGVIEHVPSSDTLDEMRQSDTPEDAASIEE